MNRTNTSRKQLICALITAAISTTTIQSDPIISDEMLWEYIKNMPKLLQHPVLQEFHRRYEKSYLVGV